VSLFAPALSYVVIPGYIFGKMIGHSQFGTNLVIAIFGLVNTYLVYLVSKKFGAKTLSAMTAGVIFILATPAFSYAGSLYQHHITTFLLLSCLLILHRSKVNFLQLLLTFLFISIAVLVDYPNLVIFAPLGLLAASKIINLKNKKNYLKLKIKPVLMLSIVSIIPIIFLLLSYNKVTYGNYFQFAGTVEGVAEVTKDGKALFRNRNEDGGLTDELIISEEKTAVGFFNTRNLINGLYTHTFGLDRGILVYTPILLFSFLGGYKLFKKKDHYLWFFVTTIGLNIVLYSLWGDPWGGWAFGSRYLIPSYSLLAILVAISLPKVRRSTLLKMVFIMLLFYSLFVNALGATTSNSNLPRVEAEELSFRSGEEQKYTFERNINLLNEGKSKAFIYNLIDVGKVNTWEYFFFTLSLPVVVMVLVLGQYFGYIDLSHATRRTKGSQINLKT
jgi:hypothetical protein